MLWHCSKGAIKKGSKSLLLPPLTSPIGALDKPQTSWLSMSIDAALGCRTTIFQIQRPAQVEVFLFLCFSFFLFFLFLEFVFSFSSFAYFQSIYCRFQNFIFFQLQTNFKL